MVQDVFIQKPLQDQVVVESRTRVGGLGVNKKWP